MKYKLSKYNVLFQENNKYYVSNTFSHSYIELDKEEYLIIESGNIEEFDDTTLGDLYKEGICVEYDLDETGLLRYKYDIAKNSSEYMEFVIAPTLECNFACPYCFETKRHHFMDEETKRLIIDFYEEKIKELSHKRVKLAWYGGEPLIRFDIVSEMTSKINKINEEYGVMCDVVMTTNGYLITKSIVDKMEKLGFKYIQITLDGPKEIHDRRRMLISGEGTYDRIVENIKLFKYSSVEVSVRINIDKDNSSSYKKIEDIITGLGMNNIRCYPALVEFTPNQAGCRECKCMTAEEFSKFASNDAKDFYFKNGGFNCSNVCVNCGAEHMNSYVIDDMGDVYKCWNSVGYESDRMFNLRNREELNPIIISKYLGRDPFSEEECKECPYIPICGGGCAYDYLFRGVHTCVPERFLYKEIIRKGDFENENN